MYKKTTVEVTSEGLLGVRAAVVDKHTAPVIDAAIIDGMSSGGGGGARSVHGSCRRITLIFDLNFRVGFEALGMRMPNG